MVTANESKLFLDAEPALRTRWLSFLIEKGRLLLELDGEMFSPDTTKAKAHAIQDAWRSYRDLLTGIPEADIHASDELNAMAFYSRSRVDVDLDGSRASLQGFIDGTRPGVSREEIRRELLVQHD
ncbi:MAG: hypothetical protein AAF656_13120 [Planctomycetota bacterium]